MSISTTPPPEPEPTPAQAAARPELDALDPGRLGAKSLVGEITRWSLALLALGLAAAMVAVALAERDTARNLADFAMVDFLQEEIEPALAACGPADAACLEQVYLNETGGLWSLRDARGRLHRSFSVGVSAFRDGAPECNRAERRSLGGVEFFACAPEGADPGLLAYRVALRGAGVNAPEFALVALEAPAWTRKVARATDGALAWRSLRSAILAMGATLIAALALSLLLLRARLSRHFGRLGRELDAFRLGARREIEGRYPAEIQDLVGSLNAAIRASAGLAERQRRNVKKMAHDLRHQLVGVDVAAREAAEGGDPAAVAQEVTALERLVERYLVLVDWVGPIEGRPTVDVADTLAATRRAFARRLRPDPDAPPLAIEILCPPGLAAAIHPTDLSIVLSNLVGNAHRHARTRIRLTATSLDARGAVAITVEDDGPGIPAAERDRALGWGERLDARAPGSGFGLTIVAEQVRELYGGALALGDSALGGLSVEVRLPGRR